MKITIEVKEIVVGSCTLLEIEVNDLSYKSLHIGQSYENTLVDIEERLLSFGELDLETFANLLLPVLLAPTVPGKEKLFRKSESPSFPIQTIPEKEKL